MSETLRILVCGSRDWTNRELLNKVLDSYKIRLGVIIEGEQRGADIMSREWGDDNGIPVERFPAAWKTQHYAAGPIRNKRMLVEGKPDLVLAFHYDLEHSKGTKNMVEQATKAGVPIVDVVRAIEKGELLPVEEEFKEGI